MSSHRNHYPSFTSQIDRDRMPADVRPFAEEINAALAYYSGDALGVARRLAADGGLVGILADALEDEGGLESLTLAADIRSKLGD